MVVIHRKETEGTDTRRDFIVSLITSDVAIQIDDVENKRTDALFAEQANHELVKGTIKGLKNLVSDTEKKQLAAIQQKLLWNQGVTTDERKNNRRMNVMQFANIICSNEKYLDVFRGLYKLKSGKDWDSEFRRLHPLS